MKKLTSVAVVFLFFLVIVTNVFANDGQPLTRIQSTVAACKDYIIKNKSSLSDDQMLTGLKNIVAPLFDFREMAKRCLGNNWKNGTEAQQQEFVDLFSDMLANAYMKKVVKGIENAEIKYPAGAVEVDGKKATVKTVIIADNESVNVAYRMMQRKDSSWWVYDVIIENIGLISNYRTEFNEIIRNGGYDKLISTLKARIEKIKKENSSENLDSAKE